MRLDTRLVLNAPARALVSTSLKMAERQEERQERRVQTMNDDLKNVEFETSEEVDVTPTFDNMGLREDLLYRLS